jgi:hypothetical protein
MTRHGPTKTRRAAAQRKEKVTARRLQEHDVVYRLEEDDNGDDCLYVYKVLKVPSKHKDVSDTEPIWCQLFKSTGNKHKLTDMVWKTFPACSLGSVDREAFEVTGSIKSYAKNKLTLAFDVQAYHDAKVVVAQGGDDSSGRRSSLWRSTR